MHISLQLGGEAVAGEPAARVLLVGPIGAELDAACDLLRQCGRFEIVPAATLAAAAASIADRAPEVIVLDAGLLDPAAPERDLRAAERRLTGELREAEARGAHTADFVAQISHEFRNPLNAICGFAEMMTAEMFGPLGHPRYQGHARNIHAAAQHLIGVVNTLLDLAKAEAGQLTLHPEQVAIADLIRNTLALLAPQAETAGIVLTAEIAADPPVIESDPGKLRQILINLVTNAIRFTPAGGRVRVQARHDATAGVLVLVISDTGIGIAPEDSRGSCSPISRRASPKPRPRRTAAWEAALGSACR